ncbi:metallophosphoesterase [Fibrobacter succinogenes]|uniref:metallophosphoesterase n=1 Tax=Fibrobacter succinogenes TaxID=833 RepID=UPI00156957A2|nr:metallophosphoesterase [Fibrobacter succinogenes]
MNSSIDFIGDIHGHYDELVVLLKKLGYQEQGGAYRFPGNARTVVFLGDYIDRGSQVRETVNLVRAMRDAGSAVALMGNHEFNALSFWHENGAGGRPLKSIRGGYLREHTFNKVAIHVKTVESYRGRKDEFAEMLDFFKTLPFYLETETFRAQHACFDLHGVQVLKDLNLRAFTDGNFDELIARANDQYNEYDDSLYEPLSLLLKGPELDLPDGLTFRDAEGVLRKRTRLRWWIDPKNANLQELSFQPGVELPLVEVPQEIHELDFYGENERPVFFGHYWLTGFPELIRDNVCCLDYSVAGYRGDGRLVAYRFDGEQKLDNQKFVSVAAGTAL